MSNEQPQSRFVSCAIVLFVILLILMYLDLIVNTN